MIKKFLFYFLTVAGFILILLSFISLVVDIFTRNIIYSLIDLLFLIIGAIILKVGYDLKEHKEEKRKETGIEPMLIGLGRLCMELDSLRKTIERLDEKLTTMEKFSRGGFSALFQKILLASIVSLGILMIVVIYTSLEMIFFINFLYFIWWFIISEHFKLLNDIRSYIWIVAIMFISPVIIMILVAILELELILVALFQYILLSLYTFIYDIYAYRIRYKRIPFFESHASGVR